MQNPEALAELARRGAVKVVKQPRPPVPWRASQTRKKKSKGGSFGFLSKLFGGGASSGSQPSGPGEDDDEDDLRREREEQEKMPESRKKNYCCRVVIPFVFFAVGVTLLIVFVTTLINVLNREDGMCSTVRFKRGKDCKDCAFEIAVTGLTKSGFINVRFNEEGQPEMEAYQGCGSTNCCDFRTSYDADTGDSTFCDAAPWNCNFRLAEGSNMPQDIEEGQLITRMIPLYVGLSFLFFMWPVISMYNIMQDNKYLLQLQKNLESRVGGAGAGAGGGSSPKAIKSGEQKI
eukprot:g11612.t1